MEMDQRAAGETGRLQLSGLEDAPALRQRIEAAQLLSDFRGHVLRRFADLTLRQRQLVVEQALVILQGHYAHLPHKVAMYAINPIRRLELLQARLEAQVDPDDPPAAAFHAEMSDIFNGLRDLHTNYLLPAPYAGRVAFLPFLVEEYFEAADDTPHYLITKIANGFDLPSLRRGVEVVRWNGMSIERAIDLNGSRFAGSNEHARHARGLESLTIRPLRIHRLPDEDEVHLSFRGENGKLERIELPWRVVENLPAFVGVDRAINDASTALAFDYDLDEANRARKMFFAPWRIVENELESAADGGSAATSVSARDLEWRGIVSGREEKSADGRRFGYIRIYSFAVADPFAFVAELSRLVRKMPKSGIIIDVRGNGGGHIWAAEMALQLFTPARIQPEAAQFATTKANKAICELYEGGRGGIDLAPWAESMRTAVQTGAQYSSAHPITPVAYANAIGQRHAGPVALITDARCYSATDIFAAGFQDHAIGPVLGVDKATGAGGANVWTHELLWDVVSSNQTKRTEFKRLPKGVGFRVSIRRMLRVGNLAGTPVEDFGVQPDEVYRMQREDLLENNSLLLERACQLLAAHAPEPEAIPWFGLELGPVRDNEINMDGRRLEVRVKSKGVDRIDIALDDRPLGSYDVVLPIGSTRQEGSTTIILEARDGLRVTLGGYKGNELLIRMHEVIMHSPDGGVRIGDGPSIAWLQASEVPERISLLTHAEGATLEAVEAEVRRVLGYGWSVDRLFGAHAEGGLAEHFRVSGRLAGATSTARAAESFEKARSLMRETTWDVQPDLPSAVMAPPREVRLDGWAAEAAGFGGKVQPAERADREWPQESLRLRQAWELARGRGKGISIGQPDTGFTMHGVLFPDGADSAVDRSRDYDVLGRDEDATDPLEARQWWLDQPGHGTATASVIVGRGVGNEVVGSAPGASLVPIRAIRSVANVFDSSVAVAVQEACNRGCHIITMSLGGIGFHPALHDSIQRAVDQGVIVLGAAGNYVRFVVAPACYGNVIAVAAINNEDRPWMHSSRGSDVDVAAPGEAVAVACASKCPAGATPPLRSGSGTSFAVAYTAGIAALWLEHHGREALIERYGAPAVQPLFKDLLRSTARRPAGWNPAFGTGVVDAEKLLRAPLTARAPAIAAVDLGSAEDRLAMYFPEGGPDHARQALAGLMPNTRPEVRALFAGEIVYRMTQSTAAYDAFTSAGTGELGAAADAAGTARGVFAMLASPELAEEIAK